MPIKANLTGTRFSMLTVVGEAPRVAGRRVEWICLCDCGNRAGPIRTGDLNTGNTKSCGCLKLVSAKANGLKRRGRPVPAAYKHGKTKTPTFVVWLGAKARCFNKSNKDWASYGGRGISMCERWASSFSDFLTDMGEAPAGLTLERLDGNRGYEPGNCVWATREAQAQNTRRCRVTPEIVRAIRQDAKNGLTGSAIARNMGLNVTTVCRIVRGKSWKNVT